MENGAEMFLPNAKRYAASAKQGSAKFVSPSFDIVEALSSHGYEVKGVIGRGGCGRVLLVISCKCEERFAVKAIPVSKRCQGENEVGFLKRLDHPNIIKAYGFWEDASFMYLLLEYCEKGSVQDLVSGQRRLKGETLLRICLDMVRAVIACHEHGIIHCDIKPGNFLIDARGRVKLCDFGISCCTESEAPREGTIAYMSPELLKSGSHVCSSKCDTWSLGISFLHLATGNLPWISRDPAKEIRSGVDFSRVGTDLDCRFKTMLVSMLSVDPNKRADLKDVETSVLDQLSNVQAAPCTKRVYVRRPLAMSVPFSPCGTRRGPVVCFVTKSPNFRPQHRIPNRVTRQNRCGMCMLCDLA